MQMWPMVGYGGGGGVAQIPAAVTGGSSVCRLVDVGSFWKAAPCQNPALRPSHLSGKHIKIGHRAVHAELLKEGKEPGGPPPSACTPYSLGL